jgi:hypothetical protein
LYKKQLKKWDKLHRYISKMVGVKVGFVGASGAASNGSTTNAGLAALHTFGTSKMPARPFLLEGLDEKKLERVMANVSELVMAGKMSGHQAMAIVGESAVAQIRAYVTDDRVRPSSDNGGTTLIDTGQMIGALNYEVIE